MTDLRTRQSRTVQFGTAYDTDIEITMHVGKHTRTARFTMFSFQNTDGKWVAAVDKMSVSRLAVAETQDLAEAKLIGLLCVALPYYNADTETEELETVSEFAEQET